MKEVKSIFLYYELGKAVMVTNHLIRPYRVIVPGGKDKHAIRPYFMGSFFRFDFVRILEMLRIW